MAKEFQKMEDMQAGKSAFRRLYTGVPDAVRPAALAGDKLQFPYFCSKSDPMKSYFLTLALGVVLAPLFSQQTLTLSIPQTTAASGEQICLDVTAADFEQLLSMQYSLQWDATVLTFERIQGFGLPGLGKDNFGTQKAEQGRLTFLWLDMSLRGLTLPDGHSLFQVCFRITGNPGQSSYVAITGEPTPIEVVNTAEKVIGLNPVAGEVRIR